MGVNNINSQEETFLYKVGKGSQRINNLKAFERNLTVQKRQEMKQMRHEIRILDESEKRFKQKFKRLGEEAEEPKKIKETDEKPQKLPEIATIKELVRIQSLLEAESRVMISELSEICHVSSKAVESAVTYLIKNNLAKKELEGRTIWICKP